jgi:RNA polymerase sigma-70 factor (ECF subfamily)
MVTVAEAMGDMGDVEAEELVRGLRTRDSELLDRLIGLYQYRLFRYLLFLTGRRESAEDLFQETWMRVLEKGHLYNGRSRFEPWLFSIAHNLFVDMVRRKKVAMNFEHLDDPEAERRFSLADPSSTAPAEHMMRDEQDAIVASALGRLPAGFREVLVLRFHEDLPLDEIAAVVKSPLSTVKSRLYRGLEMLREALEGTT